MRVLSLILALTIAAAGGARAQTLTADDYAEIRNVAQYYNLGYDSTARLDGGANVAGAFTSDMRFTRDTGQGWFSRKEFAEYASKNVGTHHWDSNFVIEPHPEGARLFRYTLVYRVDDSGGIAISSAGPLYEVLAKTPEGWFIKTRYNFSAGGEKAVEFPRFEGRPIAPPRASGASREAPAQTGRSSARAGQPLSALDYIEIEMLYGWNNIALDSAAEKGEMFARTFTADGSLQIDGQTVTGRKNLAEFAARGEPAIRRWLSNLYIEPAAEGAIGWAYVVTTDWVNGPNGPPQRPVVQRGGLYRDVLVKTPDGWRFKSRTYAPGNGVPTPLPVPRVR